MTKLNWILAPAFLENWQLCTVMDLFSCSLANGGNTNTLANKQVPFCAVRFCGWTLILSILTIKKTIMLEKLKDKNGFEIPLDSIIYGKLPNQQENHFWNYGLCHNGISLEMIACTYGYVHNVTQNEVKEMLLIGSLEEHTHLLQCD